MSILLNIFATLLLGIFAPFGARLLHAAIKDLATLIIGHGKHAIRTIPGILVMLVGHALLLLIWALALGCCMDIWWAVSGGGMWYVLSILLTLALFIGVEILYIIQSTKQDVEDDKHRFSSRHSVLRGMQTEMGIVIGLILAGTVLLHVFPSIYTWARGMWAGLL